MELMMTTRYLDDLAGLGVTLPVKATNTRAIFDAALAAAAKRPADDLRDALAAGELNAGNVAEKVWQAAADETARASAHQLITALHIPLNRMIRDALREDADKITRELAALFDKAAKVIRDAAAAGITPHTEPAEVIAGPRHDALRMAQGRGCDDHAQ